MFRHQSLDLIFARCIWNDIFQFEKISATSLDDCINMQMVWFIISPFPKSGWRCSHYPVSTRTVPWEKQQEEGQRIANEVEEARQTQTWITVKDPGDKRYIPRKGKFRNVFLRLGLERLERMSVLSVGGLTVKTLITHRWFGSTEYDMCVF